MFPTDIALKILHNGWKKCKSHLQIVTQKTTLTLKAVEQRIKTSNLWKNKAAKVKVSRNVYWLDLDKQLS